MNSLKNGTKVLMGETSAKWMLDHPDIYAVGNKVDQKLFDIEVQLHMLCTMGEPVYGTITGTATDAAIYKIRWQVGALKAEYYLERRHFEVVK